MAKIEDSRVSKMAAAAILNIWFLQRLRKNGLVRYCSPKGPEQGSTVKNRSS